MSINKFTTLLDLSRQAKIISGETATFDGKIEAGIPFSGYPTGVDTGTTVSLGVVSTQTAVFSGNTGTTKFDVSNQSSPNYNIVFSAYTASTWSNPIFSAQTSGLTLPITTFSADTQIVGPFWTLTQTGYTGDYIIGTQYTGYSITYSFNGVSSSLSGTSFSGFTTASQENFSAGTLDYKGPLDYLQSVEDATIDGRLYTNKITIKNGASSATTNYILTQTDDTGNGEWNSVSSLLSGSCHPIINLEVISGCGISGLTIESDVTVNGDVIINGSATTINTEIIQSKDNNIILNYSGTHLTAIGGGITLEDGQSDGVDSSIVTDSDGVWVFDPSLISPSLTAGTIGDSVTCVKDLYVSKIHSCGTLYINDNDEGDIEVGSNSNLIFDINNSYLGINKYPSFPLDIFNKNGNLYFRPAITTNTLAVSGDTKRISQFMAQDDTTYVTLGIVGSGCNIFPTIGDQGDSFIYSDRKTNILNIINDAGGVGNHIRFFAGNNATSTSDIHIQGSGTTRGYVGMGTEEPTKKLDVRGETLLSGSNTNVLSVIGSGSSTTEPIVSISGSSGELFTIKDTLVDSLYSVNDISGLPILEVFDNDTVLIGSYSAPAMHSSVKSYAYTGLTNIHSLLMSGYTGVWYDYTVSNTITPGVRAGQIMAVFSGNTVNYVETTTSSIGTTSGLTFSFSADSTNCILQSSATTVGFIVKAIIRSI